SDLVCMFSPCSQGVSSTKNPNRKTCIPDQRWTVHVNWSPGASSCPLLLGGPGGGMFQDGKRQRINSPRPQACVCVCVLCRLHIFTCVAVCSVSLVRLKSDNYYYICLCITIEILSNMETKLCLVLHVDHKPLNIQTTLLNRLRNVNTIVIFIQLHRSSTVHLRLFTDQSSLRHHVSTSQQ